MYNIRSAQQRVERTLYYLLFKVRNKEGKMEYYLCELSVLFLHTKNWLDFCGIRAHIQPQCIVEVRWNENKNVKIERNKKTREFFFIIIFVSSFFKFFLLNVCNFFFQHNTHELKEFERLLETQRIGNDFFFVFMKALIIFLLRLRTLFGLIGIINL